MKVAAKRNAIRQFVNGLNGGFYTVVFEKKTAPGVERTMNCRQDVAKHAKGGVNNCAGKEDLLPTYSMDSKGYRTIWLDGVLEVRGGGATLNFRKEEK